MSSYCFPFPLRKKKNKTIAYTQVTNSWEKKRKAKEKGKDTPTESELQKIARRDKKAFLCEQCKETEENNRMGRTTEISRKLEVSRKHFMQG